MHVYFLIPFYHVIWSFLRGILHSVEGMETTPLYNKRVFVIYNAFRDQWSLLSLMPSNKNILRTRQPLQRFPTFRPIHPILEVLRTYWWSKPSAREFHVSQAIQQKWANYLLGEYITIHSVKWLWYPIFLNISMTVELIQCSAPRMNSGIHICVRTSISVLSNYALVFTNRKKPARTMIMQRWVISDVNLQYVYSKWLNWNRSLAITNECKLPAYVLDWFWPSWVNEDNEKPTTTGRHVHVRGLFTNHALIHKIWVILIVGIHSVQWHPRWPRFSAGDCLCKQMGSWTRMNHLVCV